MYTGVAYAGYPPPLMPIKTQAKKPFSLHSEKK
jgi:hypothetical protein